MSRDTPAPRTAALFSLSDKTGAAELARALHERGTEIYATGGTRQFLEQHGVPARDVGDLTGFPELFSGRVKTLHPKIFGGILYDRDDTEHREEAERYAIPQIRTVVVNLYPFEATVARAGTTLSEAIEQIDIGGVALLRAAAKNFEHVTVLTHPSQYPEYRRAVESGDVAPALRRKFAIAAFERTAEYDVAISHYLATAGEVLPTDLPGALALTLPLAKRFATARIRRSAPRSISIVRSGCPSSFTGKPSPTTTCSTSTQPCGCSRARRWAPNSAASVGGSYARRS